MKRLISALLAIFTVAALICVPVVTVSAEEPTPVEGKWDGTAVDNDDNPITALTTDPEYTGPAAAGTAENPYLIRCAGDLLFLQQLLNKQSASTGYESKYYKQTADIDLNNQPWFPIGKGSSNYFTGTYDATKEDGGNYKITGLYIKAQSGLAQDKVGLFGMTKAGTFKNMTVEGVISYEYTGTTQNVNVGGIVGYVNTAATTFENCYTNIDITVTATVTTGKINVGGIAGWAVGAITLKGCHTKGEIKTTTTGATFVGGLVGKKTGNQATNVTACVAENDITFNAGNSPQFNVGGLIGSAIEGTSGKTITGSYYTGDIVIDSATEQASSNTTTVGGIAGTLVENGAVIDNCHMLGTVTVNDMTVGTDSKIALFVGDWGATGTQAQCTITNSSCLVPPSSSNDVDEFDNVLGAVQAAQTTPANITTITNNTAAADSVLELKAVQDKKVDANNISVRFLATISADDLDTVDTIGFKVSAIAPVAAVGETPATGKIAANKDYALDAVYKSLNVGATNSITATNIGGTEGDYIAGLEITEIPTTGTIALAVQTYYTVDSETVYGATNIVFYNNGEYVGYTTPTMGDIAD